MHAPAQANVFQVSVPTTISVLSRACSPKPQPNKLSSPTLSPTCDLAICHNVLSSSRHSYMPTKSYGSLTLPVSTSKSSKASSSAASQGYVLATSATSDGEISKRLARTTATPSSCRKRNSLSPTNSMRMPSDGFHLPKGIPMNLSSPCLPQPPSKKQLHNGCNVPTSPSTSPSTRLVTAMPRWHLWQEPTSIPSPNFSDIATSKPPPSMPQSLTRYETMPTTASHASTKNGLRRDAEPTTSGTYLFNGKKAFIHR